MGKRRRKQNQTDKWEVTTENRDIYTTEEKDNVSNKICPESKRIKKPKEIIFDSHQIESNEKFAIMGKKANSAKVNISTETQDNISSTLLPADVTCVTVSSKKNKKRQQSVVQDETNNEKLVVSSVEVDESDKKKRKKLKKNIAADLVVHMEESSGKLPVANSKKNGKKIIQETATKEVNNDKKSRQEALNINGKITKNNSILHDEVLNSEQKVNNDNKEKPKKKKKRKIVEEEVVDDVEIDRFCDDLDEFHNKKYENWVKLIEENLNKNVK